MQSARSNWLLQGGGEEPLHLQRSGAADHPIEAAEELCSKTRHPWNSTNTISTGGSWNTNISERKI